MLNHRQNFLRLTSLLVVFTSLASLGTLRADEKQTDAVTARRPHARKHAEARKNGKLTNEKLQHVAQRLEELETELNRLMERVTANHPKVKQIEIQIRTLRDRVSHEREIQRNRERQRMKARQQQIREQKKLRTGKHEQEPNHESGKRGSKRPGRDRDIQNRERMKHVQEAIEHLHAAGLHGLADRIGAEVRHRHQAWKHEARPGLNRGYHEREHNRYGQGANEELWRVVRQLGQAIQNVERHARNSDEIQRAVEESHRNVNHMQREFELRMREIEQAVQHHIRNIEHLVKEHSGQLEEAIKRIERHAERRLGEQEQRLDELNERLEQKCHGDEDEDEDEEHEHHHHGDHDHDHES